MNWSKSDVQNVKKIEKMSNSQDEDLTLKESTEVPLFKVCPFDESLNVSKSYVCYRNEVCCAQGCCSVFSYKYFQNWHFWLTALVIFAIFYLIGRYCKKLERQRAAREEHCNNNRALNRVNPTQYASSHVSEVSPRAGFDESNVNNLLEHFFHTYNRNRCYQCPVPKPLTSGEPPPGYSVALNMPKPDHKDCDTDCHRTATQTTTRTPSQTPTRSTSKAAQEDTVPSYEAATGKSNPKDDDKKSPKSPK